MTAGFPAVIFARRAPIKSRGFPAASAWRRTVAAPRVFFASAISSTLTARILSRISATRELLGKFHECVELGTRGTALDQVERPFHTVLETCRLAGYVDCGSGIERDDVPRGSGLVFQRRYHNASRLLDRSHAQRFRIVHGQAEFFRVDRVLENLPVPQL